MATAAAAVCLVTFSAHESGLKRDESLPSLRHRFSFLPQRMLQLGLTVDFPSGVHSPVLRVPSQACLSGSSSASRVASVYRPVIETHSQDEVELPTSALAIAAAATSVSSAPFDFLTKIGDPGQLLSAPSAEFLALCSEQLSLCEKIVGPQTNLTVYVRTAESYATGQLEFFFAAGYPSTLPSWSLGSYKEVLMLTDKSEDEGSISLVESALVQHEAVELPDVSALVLPLVKDMFLVGLLVAEQNIVKKKPGRLKPVRPPWPPKDRTVLLPSASNYAKEVMTTKSDKVADEHPTLGTFTKEQQRETAKVARTLALACVMDQRSVLLQQSSWQKGVRIDNLVEQVRGPLMAVRTLGKMLLPQFKRGEISRDVVEDILVQGDRMNDVVQQLQKVLYLTNTGGSSAQYDDCLQDLKAGQTAISKGDLALKELRPLPGAQNTVKMDGLTFDSSGERQHPSSRLGTSVFGRDEESPMPPLALAAPPEEEIRQCNAAQVLYKLVRAASSLAQQKNQTLQLTSSSQDIPLMAAIDELSLHQALSNLLEYSIQHTPAGGHITAEVMGAPGGGVLVVIEDNGPDMGLLVQERLLGPLGLALSRSSKRSTNNKKSFEAGLRLIAAREVLEQSSAVLNIKSPYLPDAPIGAGGTRVEIWLPQAADTHAKF